MGNGPKVDFKCREGLRQFMHATPESSRDLSAAVAVINSTQRLRTIIRTHWDDCGGWAGFGPRHELFKECPADLRHITGENQIPFRVSLRERCMHARQWPASRENVFDNGITKVSIPANFSDQSYLIDRSTCLGCNEFHEPAALKREQRFVAAHARTAASNQYEPGAFHAEMITLEESVRFI